MRRLIPMLLLAACTTAIHVDASAVEAAGGVRVYFLREVASVDEHTARLEAEGGRLGRPIHSPDRRAVSVLWRAPHGLLRCRYPYGGVGEYRAGSGLVSGSFQYVFLESEGVTVTADLPRGCPMMPAVVLRIESPRPGWIIFPGHKAHAFDRGTTHMRFRFPADEAGRLLMGDYLFRLRRASKRDLTFRIGIDSDGAPAAVTGYLRNWSGALDWRGHGGR